MCDALDTRGEVDVLIDVARRTAPFLTGDAPIFGSPEWLDLDAGDPRVSAAVVRAALAWWRMGEPLEDVEARADAAEERASSVAISAGLGDSRGAGSWRRTHAELVRARARAAAVVPAPRIAPEATARWVTLGGAAADVAGGDLVGEAR